MQVIKRSLTFSIANVCPNNARIVETINNFVRQQTLFSVSKRKNKTPGYYSPDVRWIFNDVDVIHGPAVTVINGLWADGIVDGRGRNQNINDIRFIHTYIHHVPFVHHGGRISGQLLRYKLLVSFTRVDVTSLVPRDVDRSRVVSEALHLLAC